MTPAAASVRCSTVCAASGSMTTAEDDGDDDGHDDDDDDAGCTPSSSSPTSPSFSLPILPDAREDPVAVSHELVRERRLHQADGLARDDEGHVRRQVRLRDLVALGDALGEARDVTDDGRARRRRFDDARGLGSRRRGDDAMRGDAGVDRGGLDLRAARCGRRRDGVGAGWRSSRRGRQPANRASEVATTTTTTRRGTRNAALGRRSSRALEESFHVR